MLLKKLHTEFEKAHQKQRSRHENKKINADATSRGKAKQGQPRRRTQETFAVSASGTRFHRRSTRLLSHFQREQSIYVN